LSYETKGDYFSAIFAKTFGGILLIFPIIILIFILGNFHRLNNDNIIKRFGSLYEGIRFSNKMSALFNFFFTIRRLILIFIVIYFKDYP
jgi:hypothetical protein